MSRSLVQLIFVLPDADAFLNAFSTYSAKLSDNYLKVNEYETKESLN